jgi:hypothetical protein
VGACSRSNPSGLAAGAERPPHDVGLKTDDRVTAAHGAALNRLEQKAHTALVVTAANELQVGGNRRFKIRDEPSPNELRFA